MQKRVDQKGLKGGLGFGGMMHWAKLVVADWVVLLYTGFLPIDSDHLFIVNGRQRTRRERETVSWHVLQRRSTTVSHMSGGLLLLINRQVMLIVLVLQLLESFQGILLLLSHHGCCRRRDCHSRTMNVMLLQLKLLHVDTSQLHLLLLALLLKHFQVMLDLELLLQ